MINYIEGDATDPAGLGPFIIAHVCNDIGGWGRGFVLALGRRHPGAERAYKLWARARRLDGNACPEEKIHPDMPPFELGWIQMVQVIPNRVFVANMIAQHDIVTTPEGIPPIRYEALGRCLATLSEEAQGLGASVHMPRIGCGLAGGEWHMVEGLIRQTLIADGVPVTVYDYDGGGPEKVAWKT
jgi:O-acetyl-ADP-ribose deacetylase (regulator of RNase III)